MAPRTVREAMHDGCECIGENQILLDAAKHMAELDVGALPICGDDDRLKGMLTDRDTVCVMDDDKRLSGIITEADVATHAPEGETGGLVEAIAAKPPQHF